MTAHSSATPHSDLLKCLRAPHTAYSKIGELRAVMNEAADLIESLSARSETAAKEVEAMHRGFAKGNADVPSSSAEPVLWRYRYKDGPWKYVEQRNDVNPLPGYNCEPLYLSTPSATATKEQRNAIIEECITELDRAGLASVYADGTHTARMLLRALKSSGAMDRTGA